MLLIGVYGEEVLSFAELAELCRVKSFLNVKLKTLKIYKFINGIKFVPGDFQQYSGGIPPGASGGIPPGGSGGIPPGGSDGIPSRDSDDILFVDSGGIPPVDYGGILPEGSGGILPVGSCSNPRECL